MATIQKRRKTELNIEDLPNEVWVKIFSFVAVASLSSFQNCKFVCQRFQSIIKEFIPTFVNYARRKVPYTGQVFSKRI